MKTALKTVLLSHLNDYSIESTVELSNEKEQTEIRERAQLRMDFVKYLILTQVSNDVEIDPDAEFKTFLEKRS